jgi:NAD(P)H-hydrate epimerase
MIQSSEIHVLDKNAEFHGIPTTTLMENAGKHVADFTLNQIKSAKNIIVFCGTGNNGGDGFVAARKISKKFNVSVFLAGKTSDIKTDISNKNFQKLKKTNVSIYDIKSSEKIDKLISESEVIIDSMLGIGLSGNLKEPYFTIVKKINNAKNKKIISVDVPTGLGTKTSVKPDYTITFHDVKNGMNKKNCGHIIIADIGIPTKSEEYVGPGEIITYYPRPKKDSHKGDNGRLLVVGGGPYFGAPALSSFAAQRTGVDLVFIITPKKVARAITSYSPLLIKPVKLAKNLAKLSPNLIVKESTNEEIIVPEDIKIVEKLEKKVDALLIGPGLGTDAKTNKAVEKITKFFVKNNKPLVIDADAIQVFGKNLRIIKNSKTVLTPHIREFRKLTGITLSNDLKDKKEKVKKWANKIGITILLKGPIDVISNGTNVKLNDVHNESMTTGGTGDILAGIVGALLSKKIEPFNAARMGIFINGTAGNFAFKKKSYGLISTDIIDEIPNVLRKYL